MTKLIAAVFVGLCLFGAWEILLYWQKVQDQKEYENKQAAAAENISPYSLNGMPSQMEGSLDAAQKNTTTFRAWLKTYGPSIQDPRKAWIQLDYCVAIARENPAEAREIFADVKQRTPPTSPVYRRVQKLARTFE